MSQYSLSYDSSGNASVVSTTPATNRTIPSGDWKISDYVSRTQDYGVEFIDSNTPEEQIKTVAKQLSPDTGGNTDTGNDKESVKVNYSPEFNWTDYTYTELEKALGADAAEAWLKANKIENVASTLNKGLGIIGILSPINPIIKGGAKIAQISAAKTKEKIVHQYINSDYFTDKHSNYEYEYELSGDYDSYSDIEYGPTYGNDYEVGTIYDAEDHGEPPGLPSTPPDNTPLGIKEDTTGGGEFSHHGGGSSYSGGDNTREARSTGNYHDPFDPGHAD